VRIVAVEACRAGWSSTTRCYAVNERMPAPSLDSPMIVDESLLPARPGVDRRRTRRVDPFERRRLALTA
jgi:hypothetical protein